MPSRTASYLVSKDSRGRLPSLTEVGALPLSHPGRLTFWRRATPTGPAGDEISCLEEDVRFRLLPVGKTEVHQRTRTNKTTHKLPGINTNDGSGLLSSPTTATVPDRPTTPAPRLTNEGCMRSTFASHGYEAEYVLATQYTIRRSPLLSNLVMGFFFMGFFVLIFLAGCVVKEYSSLLKFHGVVRPSWFTQPWVPQRWDNGGRGHGFVVDSDWNWLQYLWNAVMRFGWLRQLHFYLETTASGGAGYRMPG